MIMQDNFALEIINHLSKSKRYCCQAVFSLGGVNDCHEGRLHSVYYPDHAELTLSQTGVWQKTKIKTENSESWCIENNRLIVRRVVAPGQNAVELFRFDSSLQAMRAHYCGQDVYRAYLVWSNASLACVVKVVGPKKKGTLTTRFLL